MNKHKIKYMSSARIKCIGKWLQEWGLEIF